MPHYFKSHVEKSFICNIRASHGLPMLCQKVWHHLVSLWRRPDIHTQQVPEQKQTRKKLWAKIIWSLQKNLNSKIHEMTYVFVREDSKQPHKFEDINIDKWINKFDPDVWTAVQIMTRPQSASSNEAHQIRRFFCMCVLLFTTNSNCSFPLHPFLDRCNCHLWGI